ncbi:hypothetical protein GCM10025773_15800 [Microbacterium jejuense]
MKGGLGLALAAAAVLLAAAPAAAHNYAATVYAALTEPEPGLVRAELDLEYVLLAIDGAREMGDTAFEQDAYDDVQASGQDPAKLTTAVLDKHTDTVTGYVLPRFSIAVAGDGEDAAACPNTLAEPYAIRLIEGVPHVHLVVEADCRDGSDADPAAYRITTQLFPGTAPGGQTTTVVTYDLLSGSGVASLDTDTDPTMTTTQDWGSRMGEFFVLGAEHLLFGLDHILFLLALIVASRRLRDIIVVATAFTVAHSMTFILAALGVVGVPAIVIEPVIALSIAVVALWYLWGQWRTRGIPPLTGGGGMPAAAPAAVPPAPRTPGGTVVLERADVEVLTVPATRTARAGFTRADWLRVGIVFAFGLVHGIGFAGALGIDEPFSWGLLGALLVFNLGIEAAQLTIIAVVFPLLLLLRRHRPRIGLWVAVLVSAAVAAIGLFWFVERLVGA